MASEDGVPEETKEKATPKVNIVDDPTKKTFYKWKLPNQFWTICRQVLILLTVVTTQVIFWYMCSYDHRHSKETIGILIVFYACDAVYIVDTIFRVIQVRRRILSSPHLTKWERIKQHFPFIADSISIIPLELFVLLVANNKSFMDRSQVEFQKVFEDGSVGQGLVEAAFGQLKNFHKTIAILKLNRLIRLYRIPAFYQSHNKNQARLNVFALETIKLGICVACFIVLLCHSVACIWFSMNCDGVVDTGYPPHCLDLGKGFHSIYKYSSLNQTDPFIWYLGGLHWSVMSLRNTGDPVLVASTGGQMLYSVITQLIGFYITIMLLILSIHVSTILDLKRSKFFHEAKGARNFASHMQMDKESNLVNFMDRSFNLEWQKGRGFTNAGMIHLLPKRLQTDIAMHMFQPMIDKSEILQTCFEPAALEVLAAHVQVKHYFGNSFLIWPKSMGACMFYIVRGSVDVMDTNSDEPTILFTIGHGSLIGETDAFFPRVRQQGVKTRVECDILKLSNSAVTKVLGEDSDAMVNVLEIVKKRTEFGNTENAEAEAEFGQRTTSLISIGEYTVEVDNENEEASPVVHISPFSWLRFFKRNPKTLAVSSAKAKDASSSLQEFEQLPETTKKYNFIPILASPGHRWEYFVVSKDTFIFDLWNFIVFTVALLYSYGLPVCVMLNSEKKTWWVDITVDLINLLDLIFKLAVFYSPSEMHSFRPQRIAHVKKEFRNPSILLSLIPVLPFHQVWRFAGTSYRSYLYVRLHLYLVRLVTVHLYFRKWEHDVRCNVILLRMIKNTIYISIYIVFFSCIFCSFGCTAYPDCRQGEDETWVGHYLTTAALSPNSKTYDPTEFYYAFSLALYWSLSTTFGIGYTTDYLVLVQKKETTLFTVHLVLSFVLLTYFFANVGAAVSGEVDNSVNHVNTKVSLLKYLDDELTDLSIMEQVNSFLDLQWKTLFSIEAPGQGGFLDVSHLMFKELLVSVVAETLHSAPFFQGMNPHVLKSFCGLCKINILPPNVCLLMEGEIVEGLHIIRRGYAEVYKGGTDILVDILSMGQSFGDIELVYDQPSRVTIRSVTYVELICISKQDFTDVLATSKVHGQEILEFRRHPEAHEWFQDHFLVTESEWRKHQYEPPSPPPQLVMWYSFKGDTRLPAEQDPYRVTFAKSGLGWTRYFLLPCGFIPTGSLIIFWDQFRSIIALLQLIFVPMVQANPYTKRDYMWIIYILDVPCALDMFVRAHTGYFDRKTNGLITHPLLTSKRYLVGPFLVDLYSSLPAYVLIDQFIDAIGFDGPSHGIRLFAYFLRLNRLVGTYRCWNFVRERFEDLTGKPMWKLALLLSIFFIFQTHFFACITTVLACPTTLAEIERQDAICYPETWITNGIHTQLLLARNESIPPANIYLYAFYYTATTSVGCGFGDFKPVGKLEQTLTSIQLFTYIIVFTYILTKVASSRSLFDYKLLKFQHGMKHLVGWLNRENVDLQLIGRILRHYDYYWMRTDGMRIEELWINLYPTLKKDVMYDTYEDVFRLVPEFDRVPRVFMREILACVQLRYYLNHEIVVRIGDICQFIYIIGSGNMVVKLGSVPNASEDDDMIQLSEGGILGSMDPTFGSAIHDCTAICWTNVDMYVIPRKEFLDILRKYPEVALNFIVPANLGNRNVITKFRFNQYKSFVKIFMRFYQADMKMHTNMDYEDHHLNLNKLSTLRTSLRREFKAAVYVQKLKQEETTTGRKPLSIRIQSESFPVILKQYEETMKQEEKAKYGTKAIYASCLLPVSRNFLFLDNLWFWAAVLSSGVTAFQFAFKRYEWALWILGFITDGIFIMKMILRFFITYYDEMGDLISHVLEIEKGYLNTYDGFIMDLFTCLPFELFTLIFTAVAPDNGDGSKQETAFLFWASLRLNRLLRLHFVVKHLSVMLRQAGITVNLVYVKIKRLIISTLVLLHWLVVIFYISTVSFEGLGGDVCDGNLTASSISPNFTPRSWIHTKKETFHRLCYPYRMTLYFLVNTFTTTGYGDIFPVSRYEIIFISLLAIMSKVYVGMALMDVLSGIQYYIDKSFHISADASLKLYQSYGLPHELINRVKAYFYYTWQQNGGVLVPDFLTQAPEVHLLDICYDAFGHVLENSPLFQNLPLQFYKFVCTKFQTVWILERDCIVKQNDLDDRLYFVHRGIVESRRDTYDDKGEVKSFKLEYSMGTSFGEVNGLIGTFNYHCTYTAKTNVDLLYLTHSQLEEIFEIFPAEKELILDRLRTNYETLS